MQRVIVVGTTGSGKTTVASALAGRLEVDHVELDALSWEANWVSAPLPVFRERVSAAIAGERWVVDGNYSATRDLVWARADTVVWLDPPRRVIMWRVTARTIRRMVRREVLWNGNRESLRTALSRDSIILWAWTTYGRRRHDYPGYFAAHPHVAIIRLRTSSDVRQFLASVSSRVAGPTA